MALEVEGKLTQLLERRSGVSANGTNWTSQDFLIEIPGQYPQTVVFNVYGDRIQLDQYQIGENDKVSFDLGGREYQGKWYNTLNAWKMERVGAAATQPAGQPAAQPAGQPAGPVEEPQASAQGDDLPF